MSSPNKSGTLASGFIAGRNWSRVMCLCMVFMASGCDKLSYDFWGERRELSVDLRLRVESGDIEAWQQLKEIVAKTNDPWAAAQIGYILHRGAAKGETIAQAQMMYEKAIKLVPEAAYNLGLIALNRGKPGEAITYFVAAAGDEDKPGLPLAMVQVGELLLKGAPPDIAPSASMAAVWFERAAHRKSLTGELRLAQLLVQGHGIPQDVERGTRILEQAALNGSRDARVALSSVYDRGIGGVKRNVELSARWLVVASQGSPLLEEAASLYMSSLSAEQRAAVNDQVSIFLSTHKGSVIEPEDLRKPIAIGKS